MGEELNIIPEVNNDSGQKKTLPLGVIIGIAAAAVIIIVVLITWILNAGHPIGSSDKLQGKYKCVQCENKDAGLMDYPDDPVFMLSVEGDQYELYFEKAEGKRGTFAGRVEKTATGKYLFYDDNGFPPSKSFFAKIGGRLSALKGKFTDDDIIKIVIKGTGSEYTVFYLKKV